MPLINDLINYNVRNKTERVHQNCEFCKVWGPNISILKHEDHNCEFFKLGDQISQF